MPTFSDIRFTPAELQEIAGQLTPADLSRMHPDDRKAALEAMIRAQGETRIGPDLIPLPGLKGLTGALAASPLAAGLKTAATSPLMQGLGAIAAAQLPSLPPWASRILELGGVMRGMPGAGGAAAAAETAGTRGAALSKADQTMLDQIGARNATIAGREAAAKSTLRSPLPTAPPAMPLPEGTTASFTGSRLRAPQTPMQELMQKGQFGGDRTTGSFPQGPGGLSNVTPPVPPPFNPPRMTLADEPPPAAAAQLRSLAKTADPALMDEIQHVSRAYNEAQAAGDTVRAQGLGKQLRELDRIGRGGPPFTPSTDEIVTSTPGVPPSKTIMNARLQAKLRKPKP